MRYLGMSQFLSKLSVNLFAQLSNFFQLHFTRKQNRAKSSFLTRILIRLSGFSMRANARRRQNSTELFPDRFGNLFGFGSDFVPARRVHAGRQFLELGPNGSP